MLRCNPDDRLSAEAILRHEWMRSVIPNESWYSSGRETPTGEFTPGKVSGKSDAYDSGKMSVNAIDASAQGKSPVGVGGNLGSKGDNEQSEKDTFDAKSSALVGGTGSPVPPVSPLGNLGIHRVNRSPSTLLHPIVEIHNAEERHEANCDDSDDRSKASSQQSSRRRSNDNESIDSRERQQTNGQAQNSGNNSNNNSGNGSQHSSNHSKNSDDSRRGRVAEEKPASVSSDDIKNEQQQAQQLAPCLSRTNSRRGLKSREAMIHFDQTTHTSGEEKGGEHHTSDRISGDNSGVSALTHRDGEEGEDIDKNGIRSRGSVNGSSSTVRSG